MGNKLTKITWTVKIIKIFIKISFQLAASTSTSLIVSLTLVVMIAASMQMYKNQLASTEAMTLVGGLMGSMIFILALTAINNLEKLMFGNGFQAKLFPEIALALFMAVLASGLVHRVSASTCFFLSLIHLYYINNVSHAIHTMPAQASSLQQKKRK